MKTKAEPTKRYTVTDGSLVLTIESDGGKWLIVTCPFDPELVTQARTIDEAFAMAYDAKQLLDECRAERKRERDAARSSDSQPLRGRVAAKRVVAKKSRKTVGV